MVYTICNNIIFSINYYKFFYIVKNYYCSYIVVYIISLFKLIYKFNK